MDTQGFILFFHYNHFYRQAPVICTLQYVYFTINFKKETKSLEAEDQCCALAIVQVRERRALNRAVAVIGRTGQLRA